MGLHCLLFLRPSSRYLWNLIFTTECPTTHHSKETTEISIYVVKRFTNLILEKIITILFVLVLGFPQFCEDCLENHRNWAYEHGSTLNCSTVQYTSRIQC